MTSILPHCTVTLNALSGILLFAGYRAVRRGQHDLHKRLMLGALAASALFLAVYVLYHALHGSRPYPYHDWTRPLYFSILIPHVILAAAIAPFIAWGVTRALRGRFAAHARLMRRVFPVWMYVSVTGVAVYLMLYTQPLLR
jgi:uncharacterized membrane protein YozB (DUF420 family)